jgi:hypothetical protein
MGSGEIPTSPYRQYHVLTRSASRRLTGVLSSLGLRVGNDLISDLVEVVELLSRSVKLQSNLVSTC